MVGSIRNYMTMEQWGDASQVFNGNGGAGLPKSLEDSGNLKRGDSPFSFISSYAVVVTVIPWAI